MIIDDFNWDRRQGMSCTPDTGPIFDHTFANVSGRIVIKMTLNVVLRIMILPLISSIMINCA